MTTIAAIELDAHGTYLMMSRPVPQVYLAGPITGTTFGECTDWRQYARQKLAGANIRGVSPMRGKEYLEAVARDAPFEADGDKYMAMSPLSTNRGIMTRDRWDATRCDVMLVNFVGSKIVSIGTIMEIAWADAKRIPVVMASEEDNIHWKHGFVKEAVGFHVATLDEALRVTEAILS